MALDTDLIGEWENPSERIRILSDSSYFFGTVDVPYYLENGGNRLNINNLTYYDRISGDPASVVGQWRDDPNKEEIYYRSDNRYISLFDRENLMYFGTYATTASSISQYAFRATVSTSGDRLVFDTIFRLPASITYDIQGDTLTLHTSRGNKTYIKV